MPDMLNAIYFILGIAKKYMFVPYKVEGWNIIYDINDMGVFGLPINVIFYYYFIKLYRKWKP